MKRQLLFNYAINNSKTINSDDLTSNMKNAAVIDIPLFQLLPNEVITRIIIKSTFYYRQNSAGLHNPNVDAIAANLQTVANNIGWVPETTVLFPIIDGFQQNAILYLNRQINSLQTSLPTLAADVNEPLMRYLTASFFMSKSTDKMISVFDSSTAHKNAEIPVYLVNNRGAAPIDINLKVFSSLYPKSTTGIPIDNISPSNVPYPLDEIAVDCERVLATFNSMIINIHELRKH